MMQLCFNLIQLILATIFRFLRIYFIDLNLNESKLAENSI